MASKYDTTSLKVFDDAIIATKLENQLITSLDMNQYITTDYTLSATPGMSIEIHTYHGTGDVEDLDMTEGNTGDIGANYTTETYEVTTTQGRVPYYDEQQMTDPTAVDKAIAHLSTQLTNDLTKKVVAEFDKGTNRVYGFGFDFAGVVEAIASMPEETNTNLFILINKKDYATLQKNLSTNLQYVEAFARTGYVGSVAGVPVVLTEAVPQGTAFLASRDAVTAYVKKGVEVEQERDANTRKTTIYGRKVMVIALTNDDKVVVLKTATDPRTGYEVLETEPSDWATAYSTKYYEIVNDQMKLIPAGTGAPTFVAGRYYQAEE